MQVRQVVLDTETTGLDPKQGHRVIEIGCVEIIGRRLGGRHFHQYLQPDRAIDAEAEKVHGIGSAFLADKPRFSQVAQAFLDYVRGAELIIHNAAFDIGFLDHELALLGDAGRMADYCTVLDSLALARQRHPGQRNTLDALCRRYDIDNSKRQLHGALLDAEILAEVYLAMTGGQVALGLEVEENQVRDEARENTVTWVGSQRPALRVIRADAEDLAAHEHYLDALDKSSGGPCLWRRAGSDQTR